MDITEIILAQHDQQRTMFAQLEEWPKDDTEGLEAMWRRLAILLETHAEAEEKFLYPHLLKVGRGMADADDGTVKGEVEDAVSDHNKIRAAVRDADAAKAGTKAWWKAVTEANIANSKHMGEEERQDLADFRLHASLQARHDIAVQFLRYEALRAAEGIEAVDKEPEAYAQNPTKEMAAAEERAAAGEPELPQEDGGDDEEITTPANA